MQGFVHSAVVRLAAVMVAAGLAGVTPWLEAPHGEASHRCQCAKGAGHHDCDCPLCAAEAARAGAATAAAGQRSKVPPCHLARAARADAAEREAAARRAASGPTLSSSCGGGDHRFDPPPAAPAFTVPQAPVVAVHVTTATLDEQAGADLGLPVEPETPPPRPA